MNLGLISLVALLIAIAIGFFKNMNVGIISIGFAMILGLVFGIGNKDILAGFSSSLLIQMVGVTYLFGIVRHNGTLEIMARRLVGLTGGHTKLIPVVMFLIGMVLSGVGPGAIPCLAIIPVIAIPVACSAGLNPIMLTIIGDLGVQATRMSPLTPETAVVVKLMEEQGVASNPIPLMAAMAVTTVLLAVIVFIYYRGWKIDERYATGEQAQIPPMKLINYLSIAGLLVLAVGVLFFGFNVGLTGFLVGSVLLFVDGDSKKAIQAVPWNVIWMVLGVGVLMNIVQLSGGVDLMVSALQTIITKNTASPIMGILAGVMSLFSSGLGVVFPTLIPTAGGLSSATGANAVSICAAIVIGGTIAGYTPISTAGALIMAGVAQQENAEERFPQNRIFVELFVISFIALALLAVLGFTGVYDIVVNMFA